MGRSEISAFDKKLREEQLRNQQRWDTFDIVVICALAFLIGALLVFYVR